MKSLIAVALLMTGAAVAVEPLKVEPPAEDEAPRVLAHARKVKDKDGCAAAAPAYRVVAAMGEGFEAAQQELGECLLDFNVATGVEAALLREEAVLLLKRAAFAGNARAQRRLATLYASPTAPEANTGEALKWALAYEANPESKLYGFQSLPSTMIQGLKKAASAETLAAAESAARDFATIKQAAYTAPPPPKRKGRGALDECPSPADEAARNR